MLKDVVSFAGAFFHSFKIKMKAILGFCSKSIMVIFSSMGNLGFLEKFVRKRWFCLRWGGA